MSGVRVYNDALRELGLTLPGFIERGKVIASLPSLGVLTLAGLTPEEWTVSYHEIDDLADADNLPESGLFAISSLTARVEDAYRLASALRARGAKVILGGLHASVLPDEAADYVDTVVVGEGESIWREVLSDYESGALKKRYVANRSRDFEPWAVPRYDLLDPSRYNRITLQTTRGCPLDCSFCAASRLISPYKKKSHERISQELDAIEAIWKQPFLELADDNTFVHKAWSRELVQVLASRKLKWFTESDISIADDLDLLVSLARSGCAQVLIGLEAIDEAALNEADTKGWKRNRRAQYLDAIQTIQDHGISVNGCFAFGFDSHTPSVFEETARFIEDARLSEVQLTLLTPFPGTALYAKFRDQGRLLRPRFWEQCTLFDLTFRPKSMSFEDLETGFADLVRYVYRSEAVERRRSDFRKCVRHARQNELQTSH